MDQSVRWELAVRRAASETGRRRKRRAVTFASCCCWRRPIRVMAALNSAERAPLLAATAWRRLLALPSVPSSLVSETEIFACHDFFIESSIASTTPSSRGGETFYILHLKKKKKRRGFASTPPGGATDGGRHPDSNRTRKENIRWCYCV